MKIKIKKIFLLFCLYFLAFSKAGAQDINDFFFEEPQPRKEDAVAHFPKQVRGLYKSDRDSTKRLRITADSLIFEVPMIQYATPKELAAKNYTLRDTVVVNNKGKTMPCIVRQDTVFFVDFVQSVYFSKSPNHVIKVMDDKIVLNKQAGENKWECALLYTENEKICLAYFDFSKKAEEISDNKKIDEIKDVNPPYFSANFKKKDFIKLVDKNYFSEKQYFFKRFDWQ